MVNKFHCAKTVEPTKESLVKGGFARSVLANLRQGVGELLFGQKVAHGRGPGGQVFGPGFLAALIHLRHTLENLLEVEKGFQGICFDWASGEHFADGFACSEWDPV